jgi:single-strand DNA-binding protein
MKDKNRVELRGRLGADPVLTTTETGRSRVSMSLCSNYEYTNKDGEKISRPEWHRIVVWGKAAENAAKYLTKGSEAEIEGRLSTREYEAKGETRYITEVVATEINYGRRPASKAEEAPAPTVQARPVQRTTVRRKNNEVTASNFVADDDIPF